MIRERAFLFILFIATLGVALVLCTENIPQAYVAVKVLEIVAKRRAR
jgi:hypothetical protein